MMQLSPRIMNMLNENVFDRIAKAPKPTPTAEVIAVTKNFENMALTLDEVAEILNMAEPFRNKRARSSDFNTEELRKHPSLRVIRTPGETAVRYIPKNTAFG